MHADHTAIHPLLECCRIPPLIGSIVCLEIEVHVRLKGRAIGCDKIRKADVSLSNNVKWNNGNGFKENEERNQDWWRQRSSERWPSLVIYNSTSLLEMTGDGNLYFYLIFHLILSYILSLSFYCRYPSPSLHSFYIHSYRYHSY